MLFSCFVLSAEVAFAQQKTIVNLSSGNNASKSSKKKRKYPSHAIKMAPLNFLSGNMPLSFEKEFHNFGFQISAGPTFHRFYDESYLGSRAYSGEPKYVWNDGATTKRDVYDNPFDALTVDAQYSLGYTLGAGLRYYYNEEGFDGGYVGFNFNLARYNYLMMTYSNQSYWLSCSDRFTDFSFQWGYQYCGDHILMDLYLGAGIRSIYASRPVYVDDYSSATVVEGMAIYDKIAPKMEAGFRMGFLW